VRMRNVFHMNSGLFGVTRQASEIEIQQTHRPETELRWVDSTWLDSSRLDFLAECTKWWCFNFFG